MPSVPVSTVEDDEDADDVLLEFVAEEEAEQMAEQMGQDPEVDAGLFELKKLRES
jgi:hypothetical protein